MEKINIAELLKDCPKGMELDCILFDNDVKVIFDGVDGINTCASIIKIVVIHDNNRISHTLTKYGQWNPYKYAKCVIFPKGKTTWDGFVPPYEFKDGDVIYAKFKSILNTELVGIYKKEDSELIYDYCSVSLNSKSFYHDNMGLINKNIIDISRLATEEEKQKLFQAIKDNEYKWNTKTKTLEKLAEPKFKVGDEIVKRNSISNSWIVSSVSSEYYGLKLPNGIEGIGVLPVSEQDDWELLSNIRPKFKVGDAIQDKDGYKVKITEVNLENECYEYESIIAKGIGGIAFSEQNNWKLILNIEPKFKVGDRVRNKNYKDYIYTIHDIVDKGYRAKEIDADCPIIILFGSQEDNYELVPNKFDITTLKPFDRVLVKSEEIGFWAPTLFGFYKENCSSPYICSNGFSYKYCIPYKGNEHLVGTTKDCGEYYKTWEL